MHVIYKLTLQLLLLEYMDSSCSVTSVLNIYMDICENAHDPGLGWQVDSSTITITMSELLMLGDT